MGRGRLIIFSNCDDIKNIFYLTWIIFNKLIIGKNILFKIILPQELFKDFSRSSMSLFVQLYIFFNYLYLNVFFCQLYDRIKVIWRKERQWLWKNFWILLDTFHVRPKLFFVSSKFKYHSVYVFRHLSRHRNYLFQLCNIVYRIKLLENFANNFTDNHRRCANT